MTTIGGSQLAIGLAACEIHLNVSIDTSAPHRNPGDKMYRDRNYRNCHCRGWFDL
ncbi:MULTISPECIES: hypothetical protein [unclassified Chamaesiphon]|uniref:hypothetical protein n=1 Tax=unclassified Chamaesiphon TaxID=2620921 RepID=UPI00286A863B|nr:MULTISPECIES: hypothetical protein [unclassified Chamaesiphon]